MGASCDNIYTFCRLDYQTSTNNDFYTLLAFGYQLAKCIFDNNFHLLGVLLPIVSYFGTIENLPNTKINHSWGHPKTLTFAEMLLAASAALFKEVSIKYGSHLKI